MSPTNAVPAVGLDGKPISLAGGAVDALRASLRGPLLRAGDPGYDESRTIWNAMIDRKPALVARCSGAADVRRAVDFARANGVLTSVRGGGHNIAGNAVCDGGLMIDLSCLRAVRVVDPAVAPLARVVLGGPAAAALEDQHPVARLGEAAGGDRPSEAAADDDGVEALSHGLLPPWPRPPAPAPRSAGPACRDNRDWCNARMGCDTTCRSHLR